MNETPQNFAHYDCSASATVAGGEVRVVRWLAADGSLSSTVVLWMPGAPEAPGLTIVGRWEAHAMDIVDFNRGLVMFDQSFASADHQVSGGRRLELRTQPTPPWSGRALLEGRFQLSHGMRLSAEWADVQAMALGADRLFLLVKDRKGGVIAQQRLDKSLFEGFQPTAEGLLAETSRMATEFHTRCHSSAIDENIVL